MKKLLLSLTVIGLFIAYGLHQKEESDNVQVTPPSSLQQNTTDTTGTIPTPTTASAGATGTISQKYKDGVYTGDLADAFYGNIQAQVTIKNGRIVDVQVPVYPNDRSTSIEINSQAIPYFKQEALQAQSAQVDIVSGATDSSMAFRKSLASALAKAQ